MLHLLYWASIALCMFILHRDVTAIRAEHERAVWRVHKTTRPEHNVIRVPLWVVSTTTKAFHYFSTAFVEKPSFASLNPDTLFGGKVSNDIDLFISNRISVLIGGAIGNTMILRVSVDDKKYLMWSQQCFNFHCKLNSM